MGVEISVVIPTFNRVNLLRRVVESLSEQDYPSDAYELIVVIDGATDDTASMLQSRQTTMPLRIHVQPNLGPAQARNVGIQMARGDVVLFLDDDILAPPDLLKWHMQWHHQGNDYVVLGNVVIPELKECNIARFLARSWMASHFSKMEEPGHEFTYEDFLNNHVSVRRKHLFAVGLYDSRGMTFDVEEMEIGYKLLRKGLRFIYEPRAVAVNEYVTTVAGFFKKCWLFGNSTPLLLKDYPEFVYMRQLRPFLQPSRKRRLLHWAMDWSPSFFERVLNRTQRYFDNRQFRVVSDWQRRVVGIWGTVAYCRGLQCRLGSLAQAEREFRSICYRLVREAPRPGGSC